MWSNQNEWYDMILYDMVWYGMIWYDRIWYDSMWQGAKLSPRPFSLHAALVVPSSQLSPQVGQRERSTLAQLPKRCPRSNILSLLRSRSQEGNVSTETSKSDEALPLLVASATPLLLPALHPCRQHPGCFVYFMGAAKYSVRLSNMLTLLS